MLDVHVLDVHVLDVHVLDVHVLDVHVLDVHVLDVHFNICMLNRKIRLHVWSPFTTYIQLKSASLKNTWSNSARQHCAH